MVRFVPPASQRRLGRVYVNGRSLTADRLRCRLPGDFGTRPQWARSYSAATVLEEGMKLEWHKPVVVEQEVGLEVTSYQSAELEQK
jgi:coenzyme PQQ precursor peptide PqqA